VLSGKAKVDGNRIVVIGQGRVACETAEFLCRRKKKDVTIIHSGLREDFGEDMEPIFERRLLLDRLEKSAVKIYHETSVVDFNPEGITAQGSHKGIIPCEQVVIDDFPIANRNPLKDLQGRITVMAIGDCAAPGDIYQAIHSGFEAGYRIS
jgi:thioredoxin reductase